MESEGLYKKNEKRKKEKNEGEYNEGESERERNRVVEREKSKK